jgi:isopentenyl-diphosphate Delta-isomerase
MIIEQVILVNPNDEPIGTMEKMEAHEKGVLHRAFSVFLMDSSHNMLLQRRALSKYHSGGLLTNACCSHQQPNQTNSQAASLRLQFELGFSTPTQDAFTFLYKAALDNNLTEHELDHVLFGVCNNAPQTFNTNEVSELIYKPLHFLMHDVVDNPSQYTAWFIIALPMFNTWYTNNILNK